MWKYNCSSFFLQLSSCLLFAPFPLKNNQNNQENANTWRWLYIHIKWRSAIWPEPVFTPHHQQSHQYVSRQQWSMWERGLIMWRSCDTRWRSSGAYSLLPVAIIAIFWGKLSPSVSNVSHYLSHGLYSCLWWSNLSGCAILSFMYNFLLNMFSLLLKMRNQMFTSVSSRFFSISSDICHNLN